MISALVLVVSLGQYNLPNYGSAGCAPGDCLKYAIGGGMTCGSCGSGSGAPTDATYIVQTANALLSAEQAMGALGTGLVVNTTTTGVQSIFAGSTCGANQYASATSVAGALTCTQVMTAQLSGTITDAQLASNYSGIGACGANTWASTLSDNAVPTCTQPGFSNLSGSITNSQLAFLKKIVTNNVTNSTVTPATTGLSWAVAANTEYGFRCVLNTSGTATSLVRFNLNGPAAATTVGFSTQRFTTTSAQTLLVLQAFSAAAQTAACTSACVTTVLPTFIYGTILNGANVGTADLQVASSTAGQAITVYRGSYCTVF